MIANTPSTPYYAVIFTSIKNVDDEGFDDMAIKMVELGSKMNGFLGIESARNEIGITVSYWASLDDIKNWKQETEHLLAQKMGREKWYAAYKIRICRVERDYSFEK